MLLLLTTVPFRCATYSRADYCSSTLISDFASSRIFEAAKKKCDPVWLSFVHELIWDSLHIAGLSLAPSESEKE